MYLYVRSCVCISVWSQELSITEANVLACYRARIVIIHKNGCSFKELENGAVLKESVSMNLVAKLSLEVMLMSGGLPPALWGAGGHLEEEERKRERKGGKEQIKHVKHT